MLHLWHQGASEIWGKLKLKVRQVSFDKDRKNDWGLHKWGNIAGEGGCTVANDARGPADVRSTLSKNNGIFCSFTQQRSLKELDQVNCGMRTAAFEHTVSCQCHINHQGKQNWLWSCVCTQVNTYPQGCIIRLSHLSVTGNLAQMLRVELQE